MTPALPADHHGDDGHDVHFACRLMPRAYLFMQPLNRLTAGSKRNSNDLLSGANEESISAVRAE